MFMMDDTTAPFGKGKSNPWEEKVTLVWILPPWTEA